VSYFVSQDVIIADDSTGDRYVIREALRGTTYSIIGEVNTTDDLFMIASRHVPDLVILDTSLPGTTDALVAIRELKRKHMGVIVIATGAMSQNAIVMESLTMGANDFLLKPLQARAVRSCVEKNSAYGG
jgi:two-component system, chemotaxis family, chemotaxis protein CheY